MTDALACEGNVLAGVTLVVVFLHLVQLLGFDALQLGVGETVAVHLLQLEEQVIVCLGLASLFGHDDTVESIHFLGCLAVVRICTGERSFGVERQFGKAIIEHVACQTAYQT